MNEKSPRKGLFAITSKSSQRFMQRDAIENQAPVFCMTIFQENLVTGHGDGYLYFWTLISRTSNLDQNENNDPSQKQKSPSKLEKVSSIKAHFHSVHSMVVWDSSSLKNSDPLLLSCGDNSIKIWTIDKLLLHEIKCFHAVCGVVIVNDLLVCGFHTHPLEVWKVTLQQGKTKIEPTQATPKDETIANTPSKEQGNISRRRSFFGFGKQKPTQNNNNNATSMIQKKTKTMESVNITSKCVGTLPTGKCCYGLFSFQGNLPQKILCSSSELDSKLLITKDSYVPKTVLWVPSSSTNDSFEPATLVQGHLSSIRSICEWNNYLVTGSGDMTIRVWSVAASDETQGFQVTHYMTLKGHMDQVTSLQAWKNLLCSGSKDKSIRIWNWKGQCISMHVSHDAVVSSLVTWKNYLISGGFDGKLCRWEDVKWQAIRILLIGWKKNDPLECWVARLPKDVFRYLIEVYLESPEGEKTVSLELYYHLA